MAQKKLKPLSYEIGGEKYTVPSTIGKPLQLQEITGVLDPWPAHASGRLVPTDQVAITKGKELVVLSEHESKLPNLVPKPRFLEYLERHLSNELRRHAVTDIAPNSVRLQIHREVFEWVIDAFKTYKPLLSGIKREYEMMLTYYREEIRKLEPMKEMLWTLSQECDQRIMKLREQEKQEIRDLKAINKQLLQRISEIKCEEDNLQCQVDNLREQLAAEHHNYRNEADARKLLISDINELRSQQEDMAIMKEQTDAEEQEDPVMLKLGYQQAKKAQTEAVQKLNEMIANYCDVIPRKEYEDLYNKHVHLTEDYQLKKTMLHDFAQKHETLLEQFNVIHKEREQLSARLGDMQRSSTPRPHWEKCGDLVYGGMERWADLMKEKTSDDLVDLLLQEISGAVGEGGALSPKGMDESVPKFLRHDAPVANRKMTKRDCRIHIREIWDERKVQKDEEAAALAKGDPYTLQPIGDFIDDFFRKTYGIPQLRVEWAYSFYDALQRFSGDERITQFLGIVNAEVDEEAHWEDMRRLGRLLEQLKMADTEKRGLLPKLAFRGVLTMAKLGGDEDTVDRLCATAETELDAQSEEMIEIDRLYLCNDEGEFGPFLKEIGKLYALEQNKYIDEIQKELADLGLAKVGVEEVKRAVSVVDPAIEVAQLNNYLSWIFVCPVDQLDEAQPNDVTSLVSRMRKGNIYRIAPRT